jgi:SAM-dependent methyltransferase
MKIRVHEARHFGTMFGAPIFLADADMDELSACPVCDDTERQQLAAQSEGAEFRGLSFTECGSCWHGYLSRRPSAEWYQRYYSAEWDTGRVTAQPAAIGLSDRAVAVLKKAPGLRRLYRGLRDIVSPPRNTHSLERENLMAMLAGIGNAKGMKFLPRGYRVLEIGSGYGGALTLFNELGFAAVGTEASPHRVEFCRMRGLDVVETSIEDVSALSRQGPFDLVYSSHVFEHILDLSGLMSQLAPMVADGGYIYIEVPNTSVAEGLLKLLHYPYHCHAFSSSSLGKLLERHGFGTVRVHMDVNLHVLACKGIATFDFPAFPSHSNISGLLRGNGAWTHERGRQRMLFDDFDVKIKCEDDGRVVYQRPRPYATQTLLKDGVPILGREFILEVEDASAPSLVRWVHPTAQAPIWMKYQ